MTTLGAPVPSVARPPLRDLRARGRDVHTRAPDPDRDAPALFRAFAGDAGMWNWMGYGPWPDLATFAAWMRGTLASSDPRWFLIARNADDSPVGMAALMNHDATHGRLELGHIWYAPAARRTTTNTEVALLAMIEAFEHLRVRRFEWKCDALNARSRVAALRLGFTEEGTFRQHLVIKGRNRDTSWFSITDAEWPAVKARLEAWLSGPRGPDGRPIGSLSG